MAMCVVLLSNSELLRIKNKQKASYKSRKTARSNKIILTRFNDRFGFNELPMNFCSRLVRRSQGRAIRYLTNVLCVYIRSACGTSCSNKPRPTWWCFRDFALLCFCKWLCGWCLPLRHLVWWIPQPLPPAFCFVSNLHTKCRFSLACQPFAAGNPHHRNICIGYSQRRS